MADAMPHLPRADRALDPAISPRSLQLARELIAQGHHPVEVGRSLVVAERSDQRTMKIRIYEDADLHGSTDPEFTLVVTCRKFGLDTVTLVQDGKKPEQLFAWMGPKGTVPVDGAVAMIHSLVERRIISPALGRKEFAELVRRGWLVPEVAAHESSLLPPE